MRVYLAAPMLGVRDALPTVRAIAAKLAEEKHEILTPHVIEDTSDVDRGLRPEDIYERDVRLLEASDVVVAEISYPSLGVGFEIAYALLRGKKVVALCEEERLEKTSALIRGIKQPNFKLIVYRNSEEATRKLIDELRSFNNSGCTTSRG